MQSNTLIVILFLIFGIFHSNAVYTNLGNVQVEEPTASLYPALAVKNPLEYEFYGGSDKTNPTSYNTPLKGNTLGKFDEIDNPRVHLGGYPTTGTGVGATTYDKRTNRFYNQVDGNNDIDGVLSRTNYNTKPAVIPSYGVPEHNAFIGDDQNKHVSGVSGRGGYGGSSTVNTGYAYPEQTIISQPTVIPGFGVPILPGFPAGQPALPNYPDTFVNHNGHGHLPNEPYNRFNRPQHNHQYHHHHHHHHDQQQPQHFYHGNQNPQVLPGNNGNQYKNIHQHGYQAHGY